MSLRTQLSNLLGGRSADDPFGFVARFDGPGELIEAARGVRQAGYTRFDAHSPFPVHGLDGAMGLCRSPVPWMVMAGGVAGGLGGLGLQVWTAVYAYPVVVSGKPLLSLPAFIPITFEMTILGAAMAAVGSMFAFNLLPMLYHPLLKHESFNRATADGFFISIDSRDRRFDPEATRVLLESIGGQDITLLEN
jgi:hypothetical protein